MPRSKSVYFFLIPDGVSRDNYAHNSLCLAEGLRDLGYEIYANINYWRSEVDDPSYLFKHDPGVSPGDCDVNILTYDWMHFVSEIPFGIKESKGPVKVYLEDAGWLSTPGLRPEFRMFDVVLKSHYNSRSASPSNYRPWSFGLTHRILKETLARPGEQRVRKLLVNFGATHNARHALREHCEHRLYPRLAGLLPIDRSTDDASVSPEEPYHRLMWEQSARRHFPNYFTRLRTAAATSCFGGRLVPASPADWSRLSRPGIRARLTWTYYSATAALTRSPPRCSQWESWRFWEALAAGSAAFMVDFEKYGIQLPEQPANWIHYIGFDLDNLNGGVERIRSDPGILGSVAKEGQVWARRQYSPLATARRFLTMLRLEQ